MIEALGAMLSAKLTRLEIHKASTELSISELAGSLPTH